MICPKCGYQNSSESKYCGRCGLALEKTKKAKGKLPVIIILICVVIALLCVGTMLPRLFHTHKWEDATCVVPMTCIDCGETKGSSLGHNWEPATCVNPKTCSDCGEIEGEKADHVWSEATCQAVSKCAVCGKETGNFADHKWIAATDSLPKTCSVCRVTEGEPVSNPLVDLIRERLPIVTYAMSSNRRVYGYEDVQLTKKNDTQYLEPGKGEIVITDISADGSSLEVNYPTDTTISGYNVLWFPFDDIISLDEIDISYQRANKKIDTYRISANDNNMIRYGGMGIGREFCFIGMNESGYFVVIYSVDEQKLFGLCIEDKIAFVKIRP